PPHGVRLAWHAGHDASRATDLSITFEQLDGVTLVTLVHGGWERAEDPAASAADYGNGWPTVLDRFARPGSMFYTVEDVSADSDERTADDQWFALVHTPGPAARDGESVFAHPLFGEHVAFLMRLRERGLLVAAGPVVPERGEGMTLVRLDPAKHVD